MEMWEKLGKGYVGLPIFVTFSVNRTVFQEKKWFESVCLNFRQQLIQNKENYTRKPRYL